MTSTLFSRTQQYGGRQPRRSATLETAREPQESGSGRPRPKEDWWRCGKPYEYLQGFPEASKNPLETLNELVETRDQDLCRQLKDDINFLVVVAGLLLAVVTTFAVQSYPMLQEDKQDTISDLLVQVVQLLNDTSTQGTATLPKPFKANHRDVVVNQLWYLSMTLSLIAVVTGTFCLQWISAFLPASASTSKPASPLDSLAMRQLRYEGVVGWGVLHAPELLLFMVQVSIALFTSGLIYFLWNINRIAAIPSLVAASIAAILLSLANLMPFFQPFLGLFYQKFLTAPQCPYKSPAAWLVQSMFSFWPSVFKRLLKSTSIASWLQVLPQPFTDFSWKKHDLMCESLRETSHGGSHPRLHYIGSCVSEAVDDLVYHAGTLDILGPFLEALQPVFSKAQDWEKFSQKKLSHDEKGFLNEEYRLVPDPQVHDNISLLEYASKIRVDFINALILQHLTLRSVKLDHILFRLRVELYIRVMNSTTFIRTRGNFSPDFGNSLHCPLQDHDDVSKLDRDLRYQFLCCAKRLIESRRATDYDILSAAAIVAIDGSPIAHVPIPEGVPQPGDPPPPDMTAPGGQPDPGPGSPDILPDEGERDEPGSPSHEITTEDPQHKDPFARLCDEVQERLVELRQSDFTDIDSYIELRQFLRLDVRAIVRGPENPLRRGGMYPLWKKPPVG